jgi:hypothetical protein
MKMNEVDLQEELEKWSKNFEALHVYNNIS